MHLDRLPGLHQDMRRQGVERCKFPFARNHARFQVIFLADQVPYVLMFGLVGGQLSFSVDVLQGYRINPGLEKDVYLELVRALGLQFDRDRPFYPAAFFEDLNLAIPRRIAPANITEPHDIARHCRDVEDADKTYFLTWQEHGKTKHVTDQNLMKTRALLGVAAYEHCRKHNISTVWTDDPNRANRHWRQQLGNLPR